MRFRLLLVPAVAALVAPFSGPAHAAPYCKVEYWRDGDSCIFEAPLGEFVYGGITHLPDNGMVPWIAVQVSFQGRVIASCFDTGTKEEPAACAERAQAFVPGYPHVCQVFGTGGVVFQCADPPPLPVPVP
jgi:hypothetical protein